MARAIDQFLAAIRQAVYGRDVREAIASGIEQCYNDSTASAQKADIEAKGAEVLASIPDTYEDLQNDVDGLKSAITYGKAEVTSFVQGARNASGQIGTNMTRCSADRTFNLLAGDKITISNIDSGIKASIAGSNGTSFIYDSNWKTGNFTYTVTDETEGLYIVNVAATEGSLNVSDIHTLTITVVFNTIIPDVQNIEEMNDDIDVIKQTVFHAPEEYSYAIGGAISAYPTRVKLPDKTKIVNDTNIVFGPLKNTSFGTSYQVAYIIYASDATTVVSNISWTDRATVGHVTVEAGQYITLSTKFSPTEIDTSQAGAVDAIANSVYFETLLSDIIAKMDEISQTTNGLKSDIMAANNIVQFYIGSYGKFNYKTGISGTCADGTTAFGSTAILLTMSNSLIAIRRPSPYAVYKSQTFTIDDICSAVGETKYTVIDNIKYIVLEGNRALCFDAINYTFATKLYNENINGLIVLVGQKARQIDGGVLAPKIYYDMCTEKEADILITLEDEQESVRILSSVVNGGKIEDTNFVQCARKANGQIGTDNTRCSTKNTYTLHEGDKISVSNIDDGIKAVIAASDGSSFIYDSNWKTANFTYTVTAQTAGKYFVNVAAVEGSLDVSDIQTLKVTIIPKTAISDIEDRLDEITGDAYTFPISNIIENRDMQNGTSLMFLWASDTHHQIHNGGTYGVTTHKIAEMGQVAEQQKVDFAVVTGDVVNGYYPVDEQKTCLIDFVNTFRSKTSVPLLLTEGNHDDNSWYASANGSSGATPTGLAQVLNNEQFTSYSMTNTIHNVHVDPLNPAGGYYYVDFAKSKIRAIFLNALDIPYIENQDLTLKYYGQWTFGFQENQLKWLAEKALKFDESGWAVVLFMHYDKNMSVNTANAQKNITNLNAIISAFVAKTSGTTTSTETDFSLSVNYDFTSNPSNEVIAWFSGHRHEDHDENISNVSHIMIINTFNATGGGYDIVTIDRSAHKIYTKRYNNGAMPLYNRTISYGS